MIRHTVLRAALCAGLLGGAAACGGTPSTTPPPATPDAGKTPTSDRGKAAGSAEKPDALGPRPELPSAKVFTPPAPVVFESRSGIKVWLLERHTLPLVSVSLSIPYGSASDPAGAAGLAYITADMMDEGAGKRDAVDLSSAVNDLGATLSLGARVDGSIAALTVLKKNFDPAFSIFADVVARPRFDPKEWKRVSDLWQNGLRKRGDDPAQVARVVSGAALYGPGTPYGHPSDGLIADAQKIKLPDLKAFYQATWRPDRATLVVVGDITKDEVLKALDRDLAGWKAPKKAAPPEVVPTASTSWKPPRLLLVDRSEAPQSMIMVMRSGVPASDPRAPLLDLINTALGGSFTSRLNQNLREEKGWTYGAGSAFTETRGQGAFLARAAVVAEATGPALKEMIGELTKMADAGLTPEEFSKVRAQDRADLVENYETTGRTAQRLATLALLGLPPAHDATATEARQKSTLAQLAELASAVDPRAATVVVVGPRAQIEPQLKALQLGEPVVWDVEGQPSGAKTTP
ncbi:M16 family metallopeptidase [Chondromyces apiculatus]|uniref:Insulinase family protein n=1 Tax=Chondromyces apiculatus DSM 436 TaxID=1192034 RepID=A0A017T2R8_9BACT|nr:pitrilysin family protein [Chondromyces apiculatus]EYF03125.1 Hypothetical protein CAP_6239 [Chondromyces apiculatus DSM 436]